MKAAAPAIELIFREKRAFFLKVLARRVGDMQIAEEILQDAFFQVSAAAEREDIVNPDGYLMRVAINLSTDWLRQEKSRRRREKAWAEANFAINRLGETEASDPLPDRVLVARQEFARLERALEILSPPVRTAFILHKIQGLSHAETAAKMNLSKSTVEKHIMKAMRRVLDAMPEYAG